MDVQNPEVYNLLALLRKFSVSQTDLGLAFSVIISETLNLDRVTKMSIETSDVLPYAQNADWRSTLRMKVNAGNRRWAAKTLLDVGSACLPQGISFLWTSLA